ncbi:hypothetical protein GCM10012284_32100 [Mangrovihabitans endophyticus]|uniref:Uncharacterized protein n=1 Tax=Mangrovihabitans endophyticus TaxID=1751298 RepID=A0A8J3C1M4_9ACTN|nr:hypothetical protein GCM10012284_32100 [Mangrovihabitans endophyticus]
MGGVGHHHADAGVLQVHPEVLPRVRIQGEQLGGASAAHPTAGIGIDDHDCPAREKTSGDLRKRGAGQARADRDLGSAEATALPQDRQDAFLVNAPDQGMYTRSVSHVATVGGAEFFRQHSGIIKPTISIGLVPA